MDVYIIDFNNFLKEILVLDRDRASDKIKEYGFSSEDIDELLSMIYQNDKEVVFVITSEY